MELCSKGDIDEIKKEFEILKNDINVQDDKGYSAFGYAVSGGNIEVAKYLLEHGANKNLTSKAGHDALYFAERNQHHEVISLLN